MLRESALLSMDAALLEARVLLEDDEIELLRWPADEEQRRQLAADGVPRLLLLAEGEPPPGSVGLLEDWIRLPLDHDELLARRNALVRRASCAAHGPELDGDGLLWWGDAWVSIPAAQSSVVELFLARVREVVRRDELVAAYVATGGSANAVAVKAMLGRLVKRFAEVGLVLQSVRGRGYLLDAPNPCPLHAGPVSRSPSGRGERRH